MDTAIVTEVPVRDSGLIDILLVGGRREVRARLRRLLDREAEFNVIGDASNAGPALKADADLRPDVVIVVPSGAPLARTMRALKRKLSGGSGHLRTVLVTDGLRQNEMR